MIIEIDKSLRLELTAQKHAEGLFDAVDKNRKHLSQFLSWVDNMQSVNHFNHYINHCKMLYSQEKEVSFVIVHNEQVVGRIGLHHMDVQNKNAEIGYWLIKNAEGKGIITSSCKALIAYGFKELNLQRIAIKAATENKKSIAIAERLGCKKEGILHQAERVNDDFVDLVLFSLVRDEWKHLH